MLLWIKLQKPLTIKRVLTCDKIKMSSEILEVPYYSQFTDVEDSAWKERACGAVCLKMLLDYLNAGAPTLDELIKEGVAMDGFGPSGWVHKTLVSLAGKYNVFLECKEFKNIYDADAVGELAFSIEEGKPVIISAVRRFSEDKKFHLVVLVGFEEEKGDVMGFYYHDPDYENKKEGSKIFVNIDTFNKKWRRLAIFVKH